MTELFNIPESLSPKLAWLKKHDLTTRYDAELESCPESPETGDACYPWVCLKEDAHGFVLARIGVGMSEESACIDYCRKNDVTHWTLEANTTPPAPASGTTTK